MLGAIWLAALARFPFALGPWWSAGLFAFAAFAARAAAAANMDAPRRSWAATVAGLLVFPITGAGFVMKRWATSRLGGESGDIYGAIVTVIEVAVLVAYAGLPI